MTETNSPPMTMDITIPGTFNRPKPKVTSPMTKAAMTTPGMDPDPPRMLTPPRTTKVTITNYHPKAIDGRVDPNREVRQTAATPAISPVRTNKMNFTRATRMPENAAPTGLLPIA